jgi:PRTRC genetic system protein C
MALKVSGKRIFKFKGTDGDKDIKDLEDPNPNMSPEEVLDFYSNHHTDLLNATIKGPELGDNDTIVYHFSFSPKTKG